MKTEFEIKIQQMLLPILEYYINAPFDVILLKNYKIKQNVATIRNMEIAIYSRDHNPPHFHVKSKDNSIDAKFLISDGSYMSGKISSQDKKRVISFFNDIKTKIILESIWNKRN